MLYWRG